jgi:hypothetical protein
MEPLLIQFKSTKKEYNQAYREYLPKKEFSPKTNIARLMVGVIEFFGLTIGFLITTTEDHSKEVLINKNMLLLFLVSMFIVFLINWLFHFSFRICIINFSSLVKIQVAENGINVFRDDGEFKYFKKGVTAFFATKNYFFIEFMNNRHEFLFIPKRVFKSADQNQQMNELMENFSHR